MLAGMVHQGSNSWYTPPNDSRATAIANGVAAQFAVGLAFQPDE